MKKEQICLNTIDVGCIWGVMSDWVELNKMTKRNHNLTVEYIGNYITYDSDAVYAVFHTRSENYFIIIDKIK